MTGSSRSRRCEAIEGRGLLVVALGLDVVDAIKEEQESPGHVDKVGQEGETTVEPHDW